MPPARTASDGAGKKRALPFKAPRPVTSTASVGASNPRSNGPAPSKTAPAKTTTNTKKSAASEGTISKPAKTTHRRQPKAPQVVISDDDVSDEDEDEDDNIQERSKRRQLDDEDIDMESDESEEDAPAVTKAVKKRATEPADIDEAPPIPPKLLTRLLYEGFEDKDVKIGKEAMLVVGKYMDTFVREALARAVFERNEQETEAGIGDGFLQVGHYLFDLSCVWIADMKATRSRIWRNLLRNFYLIFERRWSRLHTPQRRISCRYVARAYSCCLQVSCVIM
jgi:hypothetical protein